MKISFITLLIAINIVSISISAQTTDSISVSYPVSKWGNVQQKLNKISDNRFYQMTFVGVPLIAGGLIVKKENGHFRSLRNKYIPNFRHHYDDYLQYAPAVALVGLKLAGVKGRSSWGRMFTSDAFSTILMAGAVNLIKAQAKVLRPDGSSYNSFPSGHTATAFMTATMLHKEYGLTRSPWYSIAGYTVATATAIGRQLNNRHWLSDVMVGAGIGILSTEFGYFLADLIFKDKGITHGYLDFKDANRYSHPSFLGYFLGFTITPGLNISLDDFKLTTATGSSAGFEGAWFLNPYIGIGGRIRASNIPVSLDSEYYFNNHPYASITESIQPAATGILSIGGGAYFSYPFTNRWLIGSKLLASTQHSSGSEVKIILKESSEEKPLTEDILKIAEFYSVGISTGLSMTYIAKQNLSVRFYADYDFIPSRVFFLFDNGEEWTNFKNRHGANALTFGASINMQF